jgi:hypothetical protein
MAEPTKQVEQKGSEMNLQIRVEPDDTGTELASLVAWLQRENDLRGTIARPATEIGPTELGANADWVALVVGSASAIRAVCRVMTIWLQSRRSDVQVHVSTGDNGNLTVVDVSNVREVMPLLERVLREGDAT